MKELEQTITKPELQHPQQVGEVLKGLRKIDGFMYNSAAIKAALDSAFSLGKVGVFMLDCIVAEETAESMSVGKLPAIDPEEAAKKSALIGQMGSIKYIAETLKNKGLEVSFWGTLGDDDFQYSVSESYSIANPTVKQATDTQIVAIAKEFQKQIEDSSVTTNIKGWLEVEQTYPEITATRGVVQDHLISHIANGSLPSKALQRFNSFIAWRTALMEGNGFKPDEYHDLIYDQAIQEMTSFVTQGHFAPGVIQKQQPGLPLIFANTYPEIGVQHLDDICLRLGKHFGLQGYQYGTIHLPGPEKLKKFLGEPKDPNAPPPIMYGCGVKLMGVRNDRGGEASVYKAIDAYKAKLKKE